MVAAIAVGSAVVGGATSIAASNKASKTAKKNAATNNALQLDIYNQNKASLSPYQAAGSAAVPQIQALLGGSGAAAQNAAFANFRNSTGYQDQFAEGQRAVTTALGNRGLLDSGAAKKALVRYGQSQANQSFNDYYSKLVGQEQIGLNAASAQAGIGQNYANAVSANNTNAANTSVNATLSNAGSINSVLQSGLSAYAFSRGMGSSYGALGAYGIYGSGGIY